MRAAVDWLVENAAGDSREGMQTLVSAAGLVAGLLEREPDDPFQAWSACSVEKAWKGRKVRRSTPWMGSTMFFS